MLPGGSRMVRLPVERSVAWPRVWLRPDQPRGPRSVPEPEPELSAERPELERAEPELSAERPEPERPEPERAEPELSVARPEPEPEPEPELSVAWAEPEPEPELSVAQAERSVGLTLVARRVVGLRVLPGGPMPVLPWRPPRRRARWLTTRPRRTT